MGQEEAEKAAAGGIEAGEKISKSTLKSGAKESTFPKDGTSEESFWQCQQDQDQTIAVGRKYIQEV